MSAAEASELLTALLQALGTDPIMLLQIAVEGCCHGELDDIYATIRQLQEQQQTNIDLLIICGDFQACTAPCPQPCTHSA